MQKAILDISGIYILQPYMQELCHDACSRHIDCTSISGTDCYCDDEAIGVIRKRIAEAGITDARGIHFIDGGNYHYLSKIWTDMVQEPFSLVVFDHHPDMQAPRFGDILSCGGWVLEVLKKNHFIRNVVIIGVKDSLVEDVREELAPSPDSKFLERVTFICESENVTQDGVQKSIERAASQLTPAVPLYISIDKDALAPAYAATNWDQGSLSTEMLKNIIASLAASHEILGIDICGERAHDFAGDEYHSVQAADTLNNALNRELAEFFEQIRPLP